MKRYAFALEINTPEEEKAAFLLITPLSEPKRLHPTWKVGLAGILSSPVKFYDDEPHLLQLGGHLPSRAYDGQTPFSAHTLHLLEDDKSVWSLPFPKALEEIDHTADIAFLIRGETPEQLHYHALVALSFYEPKFTSLIPIPRSSSDLNSIIMHLNSLISHVDAETGCSLKAVSFHGKTEEKEGYLEWEMIIDV